MYICVHIYIYNYMHIHVGMFLFACSLFCREADPVALDSCLPFTFFDNGQLIIGFVG